MIGRGGNIQICRRNISRNQRANQKRIEQPTSAKPNVSKECITLNDLAARKISSYYIARQNDLLDSAILILEKATKCDSSYFLAHSNLATALSLKGDYQAAIKVVNKLLQLTKNDPEIVFYKGILYEKQNKKELALNEYALAKRYMKTN
jgi:tetratricopeptide (TPR) repeat protein